MIDYITQTLIKDWDSFGLQEQLPGYLYFTRIGSLRYRPQEGTVTFLVHADKNIHPSLVVKITKNKDSESLVLREHQTLAHLHQISSGKLCSSIPQPVKLFKVGDNSVFVMSFLHGNPLKRYFRARGLCWHRDHILKETEHASAWLGLFSEVTKSLWQYVPAESYISEMQKKYASKWGLSSVEQVLFDRIKTELLNSNIALMPAHGDFSVFNVLDSGKDVAVIDWVQYHEAAPPLSDLVNFLIVRSAKGMKLKCPGNLMPLHRMADNKIWYGTMANDMILREAAACFWPGKDLVNIMAVTLAFSATRTVEDVGHRDSPLSRRAELFRDLAQWATDRKH